MNSDDRILLRHLHGELPTEEALDLERRLTREPALAQRQTELAGLWHSLEGPPMPRHDPALTSQVVAAVREQGELALPAPRWARTGAVGALLLGAWLGFLVGPLVGPNLKPSAAPTAVVADRLDLASGFDGLDPDLGSLDLGQEDLTAYEELTLEEAFASAPSLAESFWFESTSPLDDAGAEDPSGPGRQ